MGAPPAPGGDNMDEQKEYARSTTVVDRRFQLQFAAQVFLLQLIVVLSFQSAMQLELEQLAERSADPAAQALLSDVAGASFQTMLVVGLVTGVLLFLLGLWFSNKVVGPLPRLARALRAMGEGDYGHRLQLRPGDVLLGLAVEFNDAAAQLEQRHGTADPQPAVDDSDVDLPQLADEASPAASPQGQPLA